MPKLLGEFLKEQQEPFALEAYLLERGRNLNSRRYNSAKFCRNIKKKKRQHVVPNCTDYLKAVFSQLVMAKNGGRRTNALTEKSKSRRGNSSEDRDVMECGSLLLEGELNRKFKWRGDEDSKQLSPISVLEETESDEDSPIHNRSSKAISQRKLKKAMHYKSQELAGSNSRDQYSISKRVLQQRKQLLIDCAREVIEKHRIGGNSREEVMGAEEVRKLVCENVWIWSQDCVNESNIFHLLHCDLLASEDEWKLQKMGICREIENAILEDVVNEIVISEI